MTDPIDRRTFLGAAAGGLAAFAITPDLDAMTNRPRRVALNVGVIGIGRQGRAVISELRKLNGVTISAVCDPDKPRRDNGAKRAGGVATFASVAEMLNADACEAVIIATPTHTHRQVAEQCIAAGVHVYCECPLAGTLEDCEAIAKAAANSKGVVAAGFQGRSNPVYTLALGFYLSDSVRDPISHRGQHHKKTNWITPASDPDRYESFNWRLDPKRSLGLAGEWGSHQFDVANWYTDMIPERVSGFGGVNFHNDGREVADSVSVNLLYPDNTVMQFQATLANSYEGSYQVFYGSNAAIKLAWSHGWMFKEADAPTQGWEVYANRQQFHNDEGITLIAGATQLAAQGDLKKGVGLPYSSLYYALENWLMSIGAGEQVACTIPDAARTTAVGIAANRAVRERSTIDVELPDV